MIYAQNLIDDGSFEEIDCPGNPINSISDVEPWYVTGADAYWLQINCPFDPVASSAVVALKSNIDPYRGLAYISLESLLSASGFFLSEGMGIKLTEPLKSGYFYYFEMAYINYEDVLSQDYEAAQCDVSPPRPMNVLFAEEKIFITSESRQVINGFIITNVITNGEIKLSDDAPGNENFRRNEWKFFWDCFEAEGNEQHVAVTGTNGRSSTDLNCFDSDSPNFLYISGHAIDALQLVEIPMRIDTSLFKCPGEIEINLLDFLDGPFVDKAIFSWEDGSSNATRQISNPGIYSIEMSLPCVTIPITLNIEEISCRADIYLGNIFTPNNDGLHDEFIPIISSDLPISSYSFSIYSRWGERVFYTKEISEGWNGQIKARVPLHGVYVWIIEYILDDGSGNVLYERGDVTLISN